MIFVKSYEVIKLVTGFWLKADYVTLLQTFQQLVRKIMLYPLFYIYGFTCVQMA